MAKSNRTFPSILQRLIRVLFKAQSLVGGSCAVAAIAYPQVEVYGLILGAFCNAFLSKALKRIIRQERPIYQTQTQATQPTNTESRSLKGAANLAIAAAVDATVELADEIGVAHPSPTPILKSLHVPPDLGHGMPSSHAMSLFYFATYLSFACFSIHLTSARYDHHHMPHPFILLLRRLLPDVMEESWDHGPGRIIFICILFSLVGLECFTRIRRRLHTLAQIVVGGVIGSLVGWFHWSYGMPLLREASRDIPPLAERSMTFVVIFTIFMTLMAALTLGQFNMNNRERVSTNSAICVGLRPRFGDPMLIFYLCVIICCVGWFSIL